MTRLRRCGRAWLLALGMLVAWASPAWSQDAEAVGSGTDWLNRLHCRLELSLPGEPSGVAFRDLDGDGRDELLATSRGPTGKPGWLLTWSDLGSAPLRLALPNYPIGPEPADTGRVWVASQAADELLLIAPLQGADAAIEQRLPLPGRPRALAGGNLTDLGPVAAVATAQGQLILATVDGELQVLPTELQAPTFVYMAGDQLFVGCQGTYSVHSFRWQDGTLVPGPGIDVKAIPRAMWGGDLGGKFAALIAGGERDIWQRTEQGWITGAPVGAIPLRLVDGVPGEVFGLSFYDLTWRRFGAGLKVLEHGYAGQDPWDLASGDWEGDGLPDLAIANRGAHRVSILRGQPGGGLRTAQSLPSGGGPHSIASGDIDGDGDVDLISIDALDDSLSFHLAQTDGSFERAPFRPKTLRAGDRGRLVDFDGDGDLDLVHRAEIAGEAGVRVWLGRASEQVGLLPETSLEVRTGGGIGDLVVADVTGDGRPELLAADPQGAVVHVLGWDKVAKSPVVRSTFQVGGAPNALAVEPRDGEVRLWICLGGTGGRKGVALFALTPGKAPFERTFVPTPHEPVDLVLARVADGRQPVVLARPAGPDGPGRLLLLRPVATGGWHAEPGIPTGTRPFAVAAGDLNGDGLDELLVGAQNSHHVNLWTRKANGNLERLPDLGAGRGVLDVAVVQLAPGQTAVVAANAFSSDLSVLK